MKCHHALIVAAVLALAAGPGRNAQAQIITLDSTERGWYDNTGFHIESNANYAVRPESRNFLVFDLSGVTQTVVAASLRLFNPSAPPAFADGYQSPNLIESYRIFDVSTDIASLTAGTGGVPAYNDLGTGLTYGARNVSAADNGAFVTVLLNAAGVAAINAAAGELAFGGHVTTWADGGQAVFSNTASENPSDGDTQLFLTPESQAPIPAPAALPAGLALLSTMRLGRRRTRRTRDRN